MGGSGKHTPGASARKGNGVRVHFPLPGPPEVRLWGGLVSGRLPKFIIASSALSPAGRPGFLSQGRGVWRLPFSLDESARGFPCLLWFPGEGRRAGGALLLVRLDLLVPRAHSLGHSLPASPPEGCGVKAEKTPRGYPPGVGRCDSGCKLSVLSSFINKVRAGREGGPSSSCEIASPSFL